MLQIVTPKLEKWDEGKQEFVYSDSYTLCLEHSLVSLSKWEAKWNKPFLSSKKKTYEETIDYIRCMTVSQANPKAYENLSDENLRDIYRYIESPMTATTFHEKDEAGENGEQITNELLYYWMINFQIPFECQKWHLNRLLTLIRVCKIKNSPPKKMSQQEIMARNAALNKARKQQMKSKG